MRFELRWGFVSSALSWRWFIDENFKHNDSTLREWPFEKRIVIDKIMINGERIEECITEF
jgi:hypothetical protein